MTIVGWCFPWDTHLAVLLGHVLGLLRFSLEYKADSIKHSIKTLSILLEAYLSMPKWCLNERQNQ